MIRWRYLGFALALWAGVVVAGEQLQQRLEQALNQGGIKGLTAAAPDVLAAADSEELFDLRLWLASAYAERASWQGALAHYDWLVAARPKQETWRQRRGEVRFRLGMMRESIADFDAYLAAHPQRQPYHWQRGISYYYAGEYKKGRLQFEAHETVNPRDVENAVFHFMCVAGESGLPAARQAILGTKGDPRVPMTEVYRLFAGLGEPQAVMTAMAQADDDGLANFYGDLYLGIYYDLHGQAKLAEAHLRSAAASKWRNTYMGGVAQIHLQALRKRLAEATQAPVE